MMFIDIIIVMCLRVPGMWYIFFCGLNDADPMQPMPRDYSAQTNEQKKEKERKISKNKWIRNESENQ